MSREIIRANSEALAHYVYPILDEGLDHALVRKAPGFRLRALGFMTGVRALHGTTGPDSRESYREQHGVAHLLDSHPQLFEKVYRDTIVAARDSFRVAVGSHLALRKEGIARSDRGEIMRRSPDLMRFAGYTAARQTVLTMPLPRPAARVLVSPFTNRAYSTPYSFPPQAFEFDSDQERLRLSPGYDEDIREFRAGLRAESVGDLAGCPARRLAATDEDGGASTMIVEYWRDYVNAIYEGNEHEQRVPGIVGD